MTCYGPGETWNSIFGHIGAAFEECRAECVGIYLSAIPEVSDIILELFQEPLGSEVHIPDKQSVAPVPGCKCVLTKKRS